jgi:ABC-type phosphate transport system permease subunit
VVADNTFAGVFFALLIWVPIVFLWVAVLVDILKRKDLSGAAVAAWLLGVMIFPIVGSIIYFAFRPRVTEEPAESMMHSRAPFPPQ